LGSSDQSGPDRCDQFPVIAASATPQCLGFATWRGGSWRPASGQQGPRSRIAGRTSLGFFECDCDVG
jgi:hypothetical protein